MTAKTIGVKAKIWDSRKQGKFARQIERNQWKAKQHKKTKDQLYVTLVTSEKLTKQIACVAWATTDAWVNKLLAR